MSDKSQLDIIKHRGQRQWTLQVPIHIPNEREIVRKATRDIDPPVRLSRKLDWIDYTVLLVCGVFVFLFAALSFGWFDFLVW